MKILYDGVTLSDQQDINSLLMCSGLNNIELDLFQEARGGGKSDNISENPQKILEILEENNCSGAVSSLNNQVQPTNESNNFIDDLKIQMNKIVRKSELEKKIDHLLTLPKLGAYELVRLENLVRQWEKRNLDAEHVFDITPKKIKKRKVFQHPIGFFSPKLLRQRKINERLGTKIRESKRRSPKIRMLGKKRQHVKNNVSPKLLRKHGVVVREMKESSVILDIGNLREGVVRTETAVNETMEEDFGQLLEDVENLSSKAINLSQEVANDDGEYTTAMLSGKVID